MQTIRKFLRPSKARSANCTKAVIEAGKSAKREFVDFNFCVPCNDIREFYADETHQLHCMKCDWALNELEAVRAARKAERQEGRYSINELLR